ncbi:MAG: S53 family peptidase [Actinomycetota bacterium]|nr:S53 family peptidase [Actinomycetota bacterium]
MSGEQLSSSPPEGRVDATVVLRRRAALPAASVQFQPMSQTVLAEGYGADPADVELVQHTLVDAGAQILEVDPGSRRIRVSAPVSTMERLFGTSLSETDTGGRRRHGELSVPAALDGVVIAVLGLDDRPQADTRHLVANAASTSYTPPQLAAIYDMPAGTDGTGQTVALIELGGGFAQPDLDTYFTGLKLPTPTVRAVGVDGAANQPGQDPQGADGEVLLDIEVVGGVAPKADIVVYFAPNTDAGFLDAVSQAAHANPTPTAMSISWGQSEDGWTAQARTAMDSAFADAVALGVTVTAAAGDSGSSDGGAGVHVDFPASSPHVLGCGGTSLRADPAVGIVTSETVWNDGASGGATGGGVSGVFALPSWQSAAGVPVRSGGSTGGLAGGRGVPDVAGDADPQTGYQVYVDGQPSVIGGTSAVAPLWAGLVARLAQSTGKRLGLLQPKLYAAAKAGAAAPGFRDITSGNNGAYTAGPGWDPCTGLGVPDGAQLLTLLTAP